MLKRPRRGLPFRARVTAAIVLWFSFGGAVLLALVIFLLRQGALHQVDFIRVPAPGTAPTGAGPVSGPMPSPPQPMTVQPLHKAAVKEMVIWSVSALVVLTLIGVAAGWWLAGRVLRPVREVTRAARRISEENLHERLGITGPSDELHEMADMFDTMLERLERAFESQRRFVANASHELRTPLTVQRALIEVELADPLPEGLADVREELLAANKEAEHLIGALLLLARSDRGLDRVEQVDLDLTTAAVVGEPTPLADQRGVELRTSIERSPVDGDAVLLKHLVSNGIRNAIQYNEPDGRVDLEVGNCRLAVSNTGPMILKDRVDDLFQPFRRLTRDRMYGQGHGLGLSIVRSIALAHGGTVHATANPTGGLTVKVCFPD